MEEGFVESSLKIWCARRDSNARPLAPEGISGKSRRYTTTAQSRSLKELARSVCRGTSSVFVKTRRKHGESCELTPPRRNVAAASRNGRSVAGEAPESLAMRCPVTIEPKAVGAVERQIAVGIVGCSWGRTCSGLTSTAHRSRRHEGRYLQQLPPFQRRQPYDLESLSSPARMG